MSTFAAGLNCAGSVFRATEAEDFGHLKDAGVARATQAIAQIGREDDVKEGSSPLRCRLWSRSRQEKQETRPANARRQPRGVGSRPPRPILSHIFSVSSPELTHRQITSYNPSLIILLLYVFFLDRSGSGHRDAEAGNTFVPRRAEKMRYPLFVHVVYGSESLKSLKSYCDRFVLPC